MLKSLDVKKCTWENRIPIMKNCEPNSNVIWKKVAEFRLSLPLFNIIYIYIYINLD